ncbi:MAG: siderophore-iron reductase FhuF [Mesobacillus sp.]|uniref:siderophore-iron reductase FhuF n=1 Tax=Mesobacillus sp. TaxID=2675271 RepID=UPI003C3E9F64
MKAELSASEVNELSKFRFATELRDGVTPIEFTSLLEESSMNSLLNKLQVEMSAPDLKTTASVWMKRHAFLAVIYLYAMSVFNKQLNAAPDSLLLVEMKKDGLWLPDFYFKSKSALLCSDENRNEWRREAVRHLFKDNIFPVMETLGKAAKISKLILWENVAVYIYWLYEKVVAEHADEVIKARAAEDFDYIILHAQGSLFGNYHQNPLARYYTEPVYQEDTNSYVRVRKTCCFSYKLNAKGFCKTCPKICGPKK